MEDVEYEVESILKQRVRSGVTQYLVKWVDWPRADATWETEDAFESATKSEAGSVVYFTATWFALLPCCCCLAAAAAADGLLTGSPYGLAGAGPAA